MRQCLFFHRTVLYPSLLMTLMLVIVACGAQEEGTLPEDAADEGAADQQGTEDVAGSAAAESSGDQAGGTPEGLEELAFYDGPNREEFLVAGAEEEGELLLYTTAVLEGVTRPLLDAFMEKYPFIEAEVFRADAGDVTQRIAEEYNAGRHDVDVLEMSTGGIVALSNMDILIPFRSPEAEAFDDAAVADTYVVTRESVYSLAYNEDLLSPEEVPQEFDDLFDQRWEGQLAVPGSGTGVNWSAAVAEHFGGTEELERLAAHGLQVQNVSGRAMVDLVIAGEVPLDLAANLSHVNQSRAEGAPVAWVPIEPVMTKSGAIGLPAQSSHPHAALLYIDFVLSEEGMQVYQDEDYRIRRADMRDEGSGGEYETVDIDVLAGDNPGEAAAEWEERFQDIFVFGG